MKIYISYKQNRTYSIYFDYLNKYNLVNRKTWNQM